MRRRRIGTFDFFRIKDSTQKLPSWVVIFAKVISLFDLRSNVSFSLQISDLLFYLLLIGHCRGAAQFIILHPRGYLENLDGVAKPVNGIVYLNIFRRSQWMLNI